VGLTTLAFEMTAKAPVGNKPTICPQCGFKNAPGATRCGSCGATIDGGGPRSKTDPLKQRAMQQTGFSVFWFAIALVVLGVLTAALVIGLPMVVTALDFEGSNGMLVSIPVWFVGGLLIGMISPGRTFVEPVVAALLVAFPTVTYLSWTQTVRTLPTFMYVIMACIGVMFTLIGSYLGERIQMGPPPKTVE
jgi:ribosomal protein L40E